MLKIQLPQSKVDISSIGLYTEGSGSSCSYWTNDSPDTPSLSIINLEQINECYNIEYSFVALIDII